MEGPGIVILFFFPSAIKIAESGVSARVGQTQLFLHLIYLYFILIGLTYFITIFCFGLFVCINYYNFLLELSFTF